MPTTPVSNVASLKGRTIFYIPLLQQIPTFAVAAATMKGAVEKAGLKLQVCNGKANPSGVAACVQQAITSNAAAIVLDAIPYGMAQNALDSAKSKGIPIVVGDQYPTAGFTNSNAVSYVPGVTDFPSQVAWWMIADSKGAANAIIAQEADNPSSMKFVADSLSIYKTYCPGCKITVKTITATTNALLASATSSNILANPDATYYYTEFEDSLQPTIQGIQQSGKSSTMSLAVGAGTTNGLGLLKANSVVKCVIVADEAYEGWALTDQALRMATKTGPTTETIPSRLFDESNIGSISVTPAAQLSGEWFGDASFKSAFATLWGVS
ncbi:MAG TPA: substrate-binding domain-containing protein [Actinomycetes bacterium]|nr:substrate-binding domain-containing protein [Actinomycetes bacterium]